MYAITKCLMNDEAENVYTLEIAIFADENIARSEYINDSVDELDAITVGISYENMGKVRALVCDLIEFDEIGENDYGEIQLKKCNTLESKIYFLELKKDENFS